MVLYTPKEVMVVPQMVLQTNQWLLQQLKTCQAEKQNLEEQLVVKEAQLASALDNLREQAQVMTHSLQNCSHRVCI